MVCRDSQGTPYCSCQMQLERLSLVMETCTVSGQPVRAIGGDFTSNGVKTRLHCPENRPEDMAICQPDTSGVTQMRCELSKRMLRVGRQCELSLGPLPVLCGGKLRRSGSGYALIGMAVTTKCSRGGRWVRRHGGALRIESETGESTTVPIDCPIDIGASHSQAAVAFRSAETDYPPELPIVLPAFQCAEASGDPQCELPADVGQALPVWRRVGRPHFGIVERAFGLLKRHEVVGKATGALQVRLIARYRAEHRGRPAHLVRQGVRPQIGAAFDGMAVRRDGRVKVGPVRCDAVCVRQADGQNSNLVVMLPGFGPTQYRGLGHRLDDSLVVAPLCDPDGGHNGKSGDPWRHRAGQ